MGNMDKMIVVTYTEQIDKATSIDEVFSIIDKSLENDKNIEKLRNELSLVLKEENRIQQEIYKLRENKVGIPGMPDMEITAALKVYELVEKEHTKRTLT